MAESAGFTVFNAVGKLVASLHQVRTMKKHDPVIVEEVDHFIEALNENFDLLRKQLPNENLWALASLETDLDMVTSYLDDNLKNGSFLKFWDGRQIKDKLKRLRQDLINKFPVKLFVTTLEVTIDAKKKMDDFGSRILELSSLNMAKIHADSIEIRKLLQPLVVNEKALASLQVAADEGSAAPTPTENDDDYYLDPITAELMVDPVKCTDGETYDRLTVFTNNLTKERQLVISCDDESVRRRLFKKFQEEGIERRCYNQRNSYRAEAFELANTGHTIEALTMMNNVLMWAPTDKECLEKRDELQLGLDAQQKLMEVSKLEAPKVVEMPKVVALPVRRPLLQGDGAWECMRDSCIAFVILSPCGVTFFCVAGVLSNLWACWMGSKDGS